MMKFFPRKLTVVKTGNQEICRLPREYLSSRLKKNAISVLGKRMRKKIAVCKRKDLRISLLHVKKEARNTKVSQGKVFLSIKK